MYIEDIVASLEALTDEELKEALSGALEQESSRYTVRPWYNFCARFREARVSREVLANYVYREAARRWAGLPPHQSD